MLQQLATTTPQPFNQPRNLKEVKEMYSSDELQGAMHETLQLRQDIEKLREIKEQIKALQDYEQALKDSIAVQMGAHTSVEDEQGNPLVTFKARTTNRFDSKTFKNDYPGVYEKYTIQSADRVMLVKG